MAQDSIGADGAFPPTHWSTVRAAGAESASDSAALEELCRAYWYPLYAYVRRRGQNASDAKDATQAFFAYFLAGHGFAKFQPGRGRFRNFLLASMQHFLANEWDRARAQKRGGAHVLVPLDDQVVAASFLDEPDPAESAERVYDRAWGLTVIARACARLQAEFDSMGKGGRFSVLEPLLSGAGTPLHFEEAAARLGITPSSVRSEVHRLKRRLREAVREEVAKTLDHHEGIDEEIRNLIAAVAL